MKSSFTGRSRQRKTRRSVLVADRLARLLISVGGAGTIVAVLGVALFLVWVVVPLFLPAKVEHLEALAAEGGAGPVPTEEILHLGVDEYRVLGWTLLASGRLEVFRLDSGERRHQVELFEPGQLVSSSFLVSGELAVFGLADGTVQLAEIGFDTEILAAGELPATVVQALEADPETPVDHGDGVVELTPQRQYRVQRLTAELGRVTRVASGPVRLVAHVERSSGPLIVALAEERAGPAAAAGEAGLRLVQISGEERSNFLTGGTTLEFDDPVDLPFEALAAGLPSHLAVSGPGSDVYVAWEDGSLLRVHRSGGEAFVAERGSLVEEGRTLTAMGFLLGNVTLVTGDSEGVIAAWFPVPREGFEGRGLRRPRRDPVGRTPRATSVLARTKELARKRSGVSRSDISPAAVSLASSERTRLMLTGFGDGEIRLYNVTNATELRSFHLPEPEPVLELVMAPKEDGLVAVTPSRVYRADLDPRHPEASTKGLFRPVWYEGYGQPQHIWQSSSGTDDFEMKLGLWPLIFGTLKATFYSMLIGAPLAILAAIFTSEFLHPRVKGVVKPAIELMASLPSVVLGFLAALVFAPWIEKAVPATLAVFVAVPLAFLVGAYLWQLLPVRLAVRHGNWRFPAMVLSLVPGIGLAFVLGPAVERWLFAGDLKAWLAWEPAGGTSGETERFASSVGGWMILVLPLSALVVSFLLDRFVGPIMRRRGAGWDRRRFALVDFAKFLAALAATVVLALAVSSLLDALGFDPRGAYVDTYVQRNALIVGFVMGFAIIPIIYTISEDALSTVPEHLRSASLGAGATPWQTAVRIVIPTAMSGLFSALMIGLGRAVGETMIVLMAAGNTPVLEWNIFEGFRTLSANIAVELPEAVQGSTHYRTLFLAALVLFVMTFAVNTVAEIIRLRFRERAYQL